MKSIDLTGRRFGKLTVIKFARKERVNGISRRFWFCRCDCGKEKEILITSLTSGNTQSCGCFKIEKLTIHGLSKSPEFRCWSGMFQRCYNPKSKRYASYGNRGIKICDRWKHFNNFYADMGKKPSKRYSIDRIDNNGDYTPSNCRWATRSQQQQNKGIINTENLCRGDNHWTRKDRKRAIQIARKNIKNAHHSGEKNNNAKLTQIKANHIRELYKYSKCLNLKQFVERYQTQLNVKRETIRKVIRRIIW